MIRKISFATFFIPYEKNSVVILIMPFRLMQ